jgi:hypothetical protein
MIATIWDGIVDEMKDLGYRIDMTEQDALADGRYTIALPVVTRDDMASTTARMRVVRDVHVRVQFREKKDTFFQRDIAVEIERVSNALRTILLFETATLEARTGGIIADIAFTAALDSMS